MMSKSIVLFVQLFFINIVAGQSILTIEDAQLDNDLVNYQFGLIKDIVTDDEGSLFILDSFQGILLFNKEGKKTGEYNRKGRGPGDYETISDFLVDSKTLLILDSNLFRISLFNKTDFSFLESYKLPMLNIGQGSKVSPNRIWSVSNEYIIEYVEPFHRGNLVSERARQYILADSAFNILNDNLFRTKDVEMLIIEEGSDFIVSMLPFARNELIDFSSNGVVYRSWTNEPCIYYSYEHEKEQQIICFDSLEATQISNETMKELMDSEDSDLYKKTRLHETYPYFEEMI